jgi:hypothetical protein
MTANIPRDSWALSPYRTFFLDDYADLDYGHRIVVDASSSSQVKIAPFLKLLDVNAINHQYIHIYYDNMKNYNPFPTNKIYQPKYAIMSFFLSTKVMNAVLQKNTYEEQLNTLINSDFISKYIITIFAYIIITRLERPDYYFRMYFDFFSFEFLNKFQINIIQFCQTYLSPNYTMFHNEDEFKTLSLSANLNSLIMSVQSQPALNRNAPIGCLILSIFQMLYIGFDTPANLIPDRVNRFELFLYNLEGISPDYIQMLNGTIKCHTDGGFIGSVVRTFPLRQQNFIFKGVQCLSPHYVIIRDAHNCPSTAKYDTHLYTMNGGHSFQWVHNKYYYPWWHTRSSTQISATRGPIFYYINARKTELNPFIMSDDEWIYTFGRMFTINNGRIYYPDQFNNLINYRCLLGKHYRPADIPANTNNTVGHNYGIDEFLSTFLVYDSNYNNAKATQLCDDMTQQLYQKSGWIQMYFNFDVVPSLVSEPNTFEYRAFLFVLSIVLNVGKNIRKTVSILDVLNYVSNIKNQLLSRSANFATSSIYQLYSLIPEKKNILTLFSWGKDANSNMNAHLDLSYLIMRGIPIIKSGILTEGDIDRINKIIGKIDVRPSLITELLYNSSGNGSYAIEHFGGSSKQKKKSPKKGSYKIYKGGIGIPSQAKSSVKKRQSLSEKLYKLGRMGLYFSGEAPLTDEEKREIADYLRVQYELYVDTFNVKLAEQLEKNYTADDFSDFKGISSLEDVKEALALKKDGNLTATRLIEFLNSLSILQKMDEPKEYEDDYHLTIKNSQQFITALIRVLFPNSPLLINNPIIHLDKVIIAFQLPERFVAINKSGLSSGRKKNNTNMSVIYQKRLRKVYVDRENGKKYIVVQREIVYLSSIRGKYKYME